MDLREISETSDAIERIKTHVKPNYNQFDVIKMQRPMISNQKKKKTNLRWNSRKSELHFSYFNWAKKKQTTAWEKKNGKFCTHFEFSVSL